MNFNYQFAIGDEVRAVKGRLLDMQPEPQFVGLVGTVTEQHTLGGSAFYVVEFRNDDHGKDEDSIDESCLEKV